MRNACRDELLEACGLLFGAGFDASFLEHLQESGLRTAWRLKALETHPDRTAGSGERFIEARRAYGLLMDYLGRRGPRNAPASARGFGPSAHRPGQRPAHRPRPQRTSWHRAAEHRPVATVPCRRLRLGEFLYHTRVITFGALIETLVCQRRQRERFCEIVLRWNYLSEGQVRALLSGRLPLERVGESAQRLRLLTPPQVRLVLTFQRMRQEPLGRILVQRGLLTPRGLEEHLSRLGLHNASVRPR